MSNEERLTEFELLIATEIAEASHQGGLSVEQLLVCCVNAMVGCLERAGVIEGRSTVRYIGGYDIDYTMTAGPTKYRITDAGRARLEELRQMAREAKDDDIAYDLRCQRDAAEARANRAEKALESLALHMPLYAECPVGASDRGCRWERDPGKRRASCEEAPPNYCRRRLLEMAFAEGAMLPDAPEASRANERAVKADNSKEGDER